MARRSGSGR